MTREVLSSSNGSFNIIQENDCDMRLSDTVNVHVTYSGSKFVLHRSKKWLGKFTYHLKKNNKEKNCWLALLQ